MSAFGTQEENSEYPQSVFGTKDPILAATLGNMGFQALHSLPVLLVCSASNIINLVDKKSGRVSDCAHLEFRFEADIKHDVFGVLSAHTISLAHEISKLAQKEQTKEISRAECLALSDLRQKWDAKSLGPHKGTLLFIVQCLYDQITNFLVVATVAQELAKNPLIEFSKRLGQNVAYAVEPANTEPQVQRRNEQLFKGERK